MRNRPKHVLAASVALLVVSSSAAAAAEPPEEEPRRELRVVQPFELPIEGESILDVRWAGKDSVYLLYGEGGVDELELREGLPRVREVLPDPDVLGLGRLLNLATSSEWVLASPIGSGFAWRKARSTGGSFDVRTKPLHGLFQDVDVHGDRVVVLGVASMEAWRREEGGIVWLGELDEDLDRWRAVVVRDEVAEDTDLFHTREAALGSIRFLDDGSLLVAPSFLPEVLHISSTGKVKDVWTEEELFADRGDEVDAKPQGEGGDVGEHQLARMAGSGVIDEVLPLPRAPAIIAREAGRAGRWRLGVLGPEVQWYDIPVPRTGARARLRGDADDEGRIVLAASGRGVAEGFRISQTEILVLEIVD